MHALYHYSENYTPSTRVKVRIYGASEAYKHWSVVVRHRLGGLA